MPRELQLIGYLRLFAKSSVEYLLVGGVGARIQGSATTTQDIDIMPNPSAENLERLARALSDEQTEKKELGATRYVAHPVVDPMEFRTSDVSSFRTRFGVIDVLMDLPGVGSFDAVHRNARQYEWETITLSVASLDDIITSKETADRAKDRRALDALYQARDHFREHPDPYQLSEQALDPERDAEPKPDRVPDDTEADPAAHNEELWEHHARWWQRTFTGGADPEYEALILPLVARHLSGAQRVLDIGCGEGQVARHAAKLGAAVVGLDPTPAQVCEAGARGGGPFYARARAEALPCRDRAFDAVVVCLALEHVDALDDAFREVARVLVPGGRLVLVLAHPLLQAPRSGWVDDRIVGERYWKIGAYLREYAEIDEMEPGVNLRFVHRPLHRYVNAMGEAGLLIDAMEEPSPPAALLEEFWDFPEAAGIPRVMLVSARRVA